MTESVLVAAPRLRLVGDTHGDRFGARVDVTAGERRGIIVVDTTNGSSDPVAEWALALRSASATRVVLPSARRRRGAVARPHVLMSDPGYLNGELTGKTVGLVALGNVGRRLLELLARSTCTCSRRSRRTGRPRRRV